MEVPRRASGEQQAVWLTRGHAEPLQPARGYYKKTWGEDAEAPQPYPGNFPSAKQTCLVTKRDLSNRRELWHDVRVIKFIQQDRQLSWYQPTKEAPREVKRE